MNTMDVQPIILKTRAEDRARRRRQRLDRGALAGLLTGAGIITPCLGVVAASLTVGEALLLLAVSIWFWVSVAYFLGRRA
jgi:predicted ribosome-associated RNA-binding protein Tma20